MKCTDTYRQEAEITTENIQDLSLPHGISQLSFFPYITYSIPPP